MVVVDGSNYRNESHRSCRHNRRRHRKASRVECIEASGVLTSRSGNGCHDKRSRRSRFRLRRDRSLDSHRTPFIRHGGEKGKNVEQFY